MYIDIVKNWINFDSNNFPPFFSFFGVIKIGLPTAVILTLHDKNFTRNFGKALSILEKLALVYSYC